MIEFYLTVNFESTPKAEAVAKYQGNNSTNTYVGGYTAKREKFLYQADFNYDFVSKYQNTYKTYGWVGSNYTTVLVNDQFESFAKEDNYGYSFSWKHIHHSPDTDISDADEGEFLFDASIATTDYSSSNINTFLYNKTIRYDSYYYQSGVYFSKTGEGINSFFLKKKSAKTSTREGTDLNLETKDIPGLSSFLQEGVDFYDVLGLLIYKQEPRKKGGIITARFTHENLFDWEDLSTDDIFYEDDEFEHPYTTLSPIKVFGNDNGTDENYVFTYQREYTFKLKTTSFESRTVTKTDPYSDTYTTTEYDRVQTVSNLSASEQTYMAGGGVGEVSIYSYLSTYISSYRALGVANSTTVEVDSTYIDYTFTEGRSYLPNPIYTAEGEGGGYTYRGKEILGNRWLKNEVIVHGRSPFTVYYKVFTEMICPLKWDSFNANLIFYKSYYTDTLNNSTSRSVSFRPAIPIYNIAENVSHIVSSMAFVSDDTIKGSKTTTASNQTNQYLVTKARYESKIKKYVTELTTKMVYRPITVTATEKVLYTYNFYITSMEGEKATFLETRYDESRNQTTGRFFLQLIDKVKDKFNYEEAVIYETNNRDYKLDFKLGGCIDKFQAGQDMRVAFGFGFWKYTALNEEGYPSGHGETEIVIYRDNPNTATASPKSHYFFKHHPKVKIGYYLSSGLGQPDSSGYIVTPATYLGDWGGYGYMPISPTISNLYFEETHQGVGYFNVNKWQSYLSSKRNQNKNLAYFTT